jgi:Stress responsive A/B Barrel Domain
MIHHVVYFQLKPEVDDAQLEEMVRGSRSLLLKVPEVLSVKSGRNLDTTSQWRFFVAFETDSLERLRAVLDDPFYLKFIEKLIRPNTLAQFGLDFEMDPSKDLKYS